MRAKDLGIYKGEMLKPNKNMVSYAITFVHTWGRSKSRA